MLCSSSLLKGGLNIPQFLLGPRCHGRIGQQMSCKFFSISTYDYIRNTCLHYIDDWSQFCVTLCYSYYLRNRIWHNYPSLIHCLRAFHILFFAYLLFRCYCYNYYKKPQNNYLYFCHCYLYYHTTLLLNTLLQILSYPGVDELTTQLLILENILWLPLCRINKFGLNTLPSKTVAIPYTCGLSRLFSCVVAGEHSSIL